MPDATKRRWWTQFETVAWIAFRDHGAVRVAANVEARAKDELPSNPFSYLAVEGALGTVRQKSGESDKPGIAVADALQQLEAAERAGNLAPNNFGRFRVAEIKKLFPSKEGRSEGQLQRGRMPDWKLVPLGMFFLTNRKRPSEHNWLGVFEWCKAEGLATSEKQYRKLRAQALRWADNELALRRQGGVGVGDSEGPLIREEYEQCRQNLASWRKPEPSKPGK